MNGFEYTQRELHFACIKTHCSHLGIPDDCNSQVVYKYSKRCHILLPQPGVIVVLGIAKGLEGIESMQTNENLDSN